MYAYRLLSTFYVTSCKNLMHGIRRLDLPVSIKVVGWVNLLEYTGYRGLKCGLNIMHVSTSIEQSLNITRQTGIFAVLMMQYEGDKSETWYLSFPHEPIRSIIDNNKYEWFLKVKITFQSVVMGEGKLSHYYSVKICLYFRRATCVRSCVCYWPMGNA